MQTKSEVTLRVLFFELTAVGLDIFSFKSAQYKQPTIPVLTGAGSPCCCTNRLPHNFETRHGNDQNLRQHRLSEAKIFWIPTNSHMPSADYVIQKPSDQIFHCRHTGTQFLLSWPMTTSGDNWNSFFYKPDALLVAQPTASKYWRTLCTAT